MNIVNILVLILSFSIAQSYPYFYKKYGDIVKSQFFNIVYYQLAIYIVFVSAISLFITEKNIIFISIISVLSQFNIQLIFLSLIINVRKKNLVSIISIICYSMLLIILFLFTNANLKLTLVAYIFFLILNSLLLILVNRIFPNRTSIDFNLFKNIITFSFFPMFTSLLITFNYNIDIIILKQFVEYSSIGIYSLGVTLAGMLWIIPDSFKEVLFNKTAKSNSIDEILFGIKFNVAISIFIILGFIVVGESFIQVFYGEDFIESYLVTSILFIGTIPMIFFKMINTLYISIGKQKLSFIILLLAVTINIILNYILIPINGILGAAISSVVSYTVCGIIILITFVIKFNIKFKDVFFINKNEISKIKKLIMGKVSYVNKNNL